MREREEEVRAAMKQAKRAQDEGRAFLRQSLAVRKQREAVESERHKVYLDRRMKAVLKLKESIEENQVGSCRQPSSL